MEEMTILKEMGRVQAPPGFERTVLDGLASGRKRHRRRKTLRLSAAGALSALTAAAAVLLVLILPGGPRSNLANLERDLGPDRFSGRSLPLVEPVDYLSEFWRVGQSSQTIYILEQVSDRTDTKVKF